MFRACLQEVLQYEGAYSNHKRDFGGETYKGISRFYHADWDGWEIVDMAKERYGGLAALKRGDVTEVLGSAYQHKLQQLVALFYKEEFWDRVRGDELAAIDGDLACEVFDIAVNMGVRQAGKLLQKAINHFALPHIAEDGVIGEQTLGALTLVRLSGNIKALVVVLQKLRALHYATIVANNPSQAVFLRGWIKRALKIS